MSQHETDRRTFLQASAAVAASAATLRAQDAPKADAPKVNPVIPKRALGKTGVEITMLDQGAVRGPTLDLAALTVLAKEFRAAQGPRDFSAGY